MLVLLAHQLVLLRHLTLLDLEILLSCLVMEQLILVSQVVVAVD